MRRSFSDGLELWAAASDPNRSEAAISCRNTIGNLRRGRPDLQFVVHVLYAFDFFRKFGRFRLTLVAVHAAFDRNDAIFYCYVKGAALHIGIDGKLLAHLVIYAVVRVSRFLAGCKRTERKQSYSNKTFHSGVSSEPSIERQSTALRKDGSSLQFGFTFTKRERNTF